MKTLTVNTYKILLLLLVTLKYVLLHFFSTDRVSNFVSFYRADILNH